MTRDHSARRVAATVAASVALLAGIFVGPAPEPAAAATTKQTTANLNMRSGASTKYKVVTVLKKGAKVSVTSTRGTWSRVAAGKKAGWVSTKYLKPVPAAKPTPKPAPRPVAKPAKPAPKAVAKIATANVNLRSGASSRHKVVVVVKKGAKVSVTSTSGTWSKATSGGKTGWLASAYLKNAPKPAAKPKPKPAPVKPAPVKPKPAPVKPAPVKPAPVKPAPVKPVPVKPAPVKPAPAKPTPAPVKPAPPVAKPAPKPAAPAPVLFATTSNLNIRASAPSGRVLATVPQGDTVAKTGATAQNGVWAQVKYGSLTGWVSVAYLQEAAAPSGTRIPSSFAVSGAGWGHGVGMSQFGAQGQAKEGRSVAQILNHYYAPAALTNTTSYAASDIRVQLLAASTSSITPSNGKLRILDGSKVLATTDDPVSLSLKDGKVSATIGSKAYTPAGTLGVQWENTRFWQGSRDTTVAVPRANEGSGTVHYRHGRIEVGVLNGRLNLVNILRLNDEYLYGLAEMPSSWAPAALQSQAVAGRTYAMRNMSSLKKSCACNVYDEVASQKFTAWNKENEGSGAYYGKRWKAAVDATISRNASGTPTSGAVLMQRGTLIDAVYFSSSGGRTRTAASVWGSEHAYLQSRDDHWSLLASSGNPNRSWTNTATQAQMAKAFGVTGVVQVSIARNPDLGIKSATATTASGISKTITGAEFRSRIATKSTWVTGVVAR